MSDSDHTVHAWHLAPVPIEPERILRVHGYRDPDGVRPAIRRIAERAAADIAALARPEARWRRMRIRANDAGTLSLDGGPTLHCGAFPRLLSGCGEVVVFVLTLGAAMDAAVAGRFANDEPVDGLFLDSGGWLCVERATRRLAAHLSGELSREGLGVTFRMGPGYDYRVESGARERWDIEEQAALFSALDGTDLPVELLESSVMLPKMSRSGLFAVAPRP